MYALEVRDHIMIAHSLPRPVFGPAQGLHGATYIVDVAFFRKRSMPIIWWWILALRPMR